MGKYYGNNSAGSSGGTILVNSGHYGQLVGVGQNQIPSNYCGPATRKESKAGKAKGSGRQSQQPAKARKIGLPQQNGILSASSREKEKTQSVNTAFTSLRTLIPTEPADRKLSKIETLRLATSYISHLSSQLHMAIHIDLPCSQSKDCCQMSSESSGHQTKICTFCLSESKKMRTSVPPPSTQSCMALRMDYNYNTEIPEESFPLESVMPNDAMSFYY